MAGAPPTLDRTLAGAALFMKARQQISLANSSMAPARPSQPASPEKMRELFVSEDLQVALEAASVETCHPAKDAG